MAAFVGVTAMAAGGCSDDPLTYPVARDRAATELCNLEARCSNIGPPPAPHATRDACLTTWKNNVQSFWPPAECDKIVKAEYDACIAQIRNTECGQNWDWLTILGKCAKMDVCGTTAP